MKKIARLRGMQDISPIETNKINFVENSFNEISKSFGYQEVRFPIIESTDLFKRSVGDQTDIVNKEMFTFESKSGKSLTLRPEGTAGCMRMAIEMGLLDAGQQRLSYKGPMFRYERPQKGRTRQFQQLSLEAYGFNDCAIDLEMLEISNLLFERLSVKKKMTLEINSIGSQNDQQEYSKKLKDYFSKYKKELDEDSLKRLEKNPLRILDSKNQELENLIKGAPKINQSISKESQENFTLLKRYLSDLKIEYQENPRLVRGLDYYNDLVFEWKSNSIGSQDTICGGGRYDKLLSLYGAVTEVPACGFGFGDCVIVELLKDKGLLPNIPKSVEFVVAAFNESMQGKAMKTASLIRAGGAEVDMLLEPKKKVANTFDYANRVGARYIVFVAPQEWENDMVRIKDLRADYTDKDEEKQIDVKISDLGRALEVLRAHEASVGAANKMGSMTVS